jgi:hypothetical protein
MPEVWKPIIDYEGLYKVSNTGKIHSLRKNKNLKGDPNNDGYLRIRLYKNCHFERLFIHRLVAEHYVKNPHGYPYVNHKDGNKLNNNETNLEYSTASQNIQHAYDLGLRRKDKLPMKKVRNIKRMYKLSTNEVTKTEIARIYGITLRTLNNILSS